MKQSVSYLRRRYARLLLFSLICLFLFGMAGYMLLEKASPVEALYLTLGTLTTVAPFTLTDGGRIFAIFLILLGFGMVAATAAFLGNMFLDGSWIEEYRRRKVRKVLNGFKEHYIICGHGQVGQIVAAELFRNGLPLVVIDSDKKAIQQCKELGAAYLENDAMEEDVLIEAGIERAKALISVVNRDADNAFVVLTARALNPDLFICARASTKGVEKKLYRAGANHVVSPYASAAIRITQNILRPTVTDFLDSALSGSGDGIELTLEEFDIPQDAAFLGKSLMDSNIRNEFDLIVVAIKRVDGTRIYNPSSLEMIHAGDVLIVVGPHANTNRFYAFLYGKPRLSENTIN
jgi:voltage-gated potassium channel